MHEHLSRSSSFLWRNFRVGSGEQEATHKLRFETMFNYLNGYMLIVYIIYGVVLALQVITIVINVSITSFYEKYAKEEKEEGLLLVEMK